MKIFLLTSLLVWGTLALAQGYDVPPPIQKLPLALTGAKVLGARPNHPIDFWVRCVGKPPYLFKAQLPKGLKIDPLTGRIQGALPKVGTYSFDVTLKNNEKEVSAPYSIVIGETIQLTPPMGWNSWYCYSEAVSDTHIRNTAKALRERGLWAYGWTYVNIDDCWQSERGGDLYAIQSNDRFPDMKALGDYVHDQGCKMGIYSSPWLSTYAGFIGGSIDTDHAEKKIYLPEDKRLQKNQVFGRWPGIDTLKVGRPGAIWLFDQDVKQWAIWGIDYVKVDWKPNDVPTTKRIHDAMRHSGRDMVLSLSNAAPIHDADSFAKYAQAWRTTGDIHDAWGSIASIGFDQNVRWQKFQRPGAYNDPDMLQIGMIGTPNNFNTQYRPSRLTPEEQKTQFSLWCIMGSPLLISCDIANMDDHTFKMLTHVGMLEINQDPLCIQGEEIQNKNGFRVLKKPLFDGTFAIGVFNLNPDKKTYQLEGFDDTSFRDVWTQLKYAKKTPITLEIPAHGCIILRSEK